VTAMNEDGTNRKQKIVIHVDGPYEVQGGIPLVHKTQVVSEYGEPLTWQKEKDIKTEETYCLCRCGRSAEMPFCDGAHRAFEFDGAETADTRTTVERQETLVDGTHIVVKYDSSLCMESGFCANRVTNIPDLLPGTADTQVRALVIAMIERCPSGCYTYSIEKGGPDIEPDLPGQIAVTTEITSAGLITGSLWVTGGILIERSDGQPLETRNRVTLCCCGLSKIKPLCDGAHRPK
jgi:CDGSH-type Zn-finger protein